MSQGFAIDAKRAEAAFVIVDNDVAFAVEGDEFGAHKVLRGFKGAEKVARVGVDQGGTIYTQENLSKVCCVQYARADYLLSRSQQCLIQPKLQHT
jgi:hypothetical protein